MTQHRPTAMDDKLRTAWHRKEFLDFDEWVRQVADALDNSELSVEVAAVRLGVGVAELEAVSQLGLLNDDDLRLIGRHSPPRTTWLQLAGATPSEIEAALTALAKHPNAAAPSQVVAAALNAISGPSAESRIAALDAKVFAHLSKKAAKYDLLTPKQRSALSGFGRTLSGGGALTQKQVAYAVGLLTLLVEGGAVRRNSPDKDVAICDAVLDSLGL